MDRRRLRGESVARFSKARVLEKFCDCAGSSSDAIECGNVVELDSWMSPSLHLSSAMGCASCPGSQMMVDIERNQSVNVGCGRLCMRHTFIITRDRTMTSTNSRNSNLQTHTTGGSGGAEDGVSLDSQFQLMINDLICGDKRGLNFQI